MPSRSSGADDAAPPGPLRPRTVLFVDVDGVLNVSSTGHTFSVLHQSLVDRLARVVRRTGAHVVLSSSWRHDRQRLALLRRAWAVARLPPLLDETPTVSTMQVLRDLSGAIERNVSHHAYQRVVEIRLWLESAADSSGDTVSWAAIDDLNLAAAAHSMKLLRGHFVQTDPRYGLQSHHVEELVGRFGEREESPAPPPLPLRSPMRMLSALADLLVISGSGSDVVVVDVHAFTIVASFDSSRQSFREWLIGQEDEVSPDRIVGIVLSNDVVDDARESGLIAECSVSIHVSTPSPGMISQFAHTLVTSCFKEAQTRTLHALLAAIHKHHQEAFCQELAVAKLHQAGFDRRTIEFLARDWSLVSRFLVSLLIVKPMDLTLARSNLLVRVCQEFASPSDVVALLALAEYTARDELRSLATLQAVSRLVRSAESSACQTEFEAIDEVVASLQ